MPVVERIDDFRHERPAAFALIISGTLSAILFSAFMALPATPVMEAVGVVEAQSRIKAGAKAVYWEYRARVHVAADVEPSVVFGTVAGVTAHGEVVLSIPREDEFSSSAFRLANVEEGSLDHQALDRLAEMLRDRSAKAEVYSDGRAVIWVDRSALNLDLIGRGGAKPDETPRTPISEQAFARYYWTIARGEKRL